MTRTLERAGPGLLADWDRLRQRYGPHRGGFCSAQACPQAPEYLALSGKHRRRLCAFHAERFAKRYGLTMEAGA